MKWDVAVVGAGPVGSFLASRTAEMGFSTVMLEEHPSIGKPVECAGLVTERALRIPGIGDEPVVWGVE
ncbi:MAG: FAD-dependent monooxygenase, partial [Thermoplasmata archaeon]|nr:FAD-dependent monooxygenase [Thermoplasmata archaeon]